MRKLLMSLICVMIFLLGACGSQIQGDAPTSVDEEIVGADWKTWGSYGIATRNMRGDTSDVYFEVNDETDEIYLIADESSYNVIQTINFPHHIEDVNYIKENVHFQDLNDDGCDDLLIYYRDSADKGGDAYELYTWAEANGCYMLTDKNSVIEYEETDNAVALAYTPILETIQDLKTDNRYFLCDVNTDGVPELFIECSVEDGTLDCYTFDIDDSGMYEARYVETVPGSESCIFAIGDEGQVIMNRFAPGVRYIYDVLFDGNKLDLFETSAEEGVTDEVGTPFIMYEVTDYVGLAY